MAKSKKNKKGPAKPSVKVDDLKPEKDPKGGALNAYLKVTSPTAALKLNSDPALKIDYSSLDTYNKIRK